MEEMNPCSVTDREVFQRVWQRVMAGRDDSPCPFGAPPSNMQGDLSCDCLDALIRQQRTGFPQECERQPQPACSTDQQMGCQPAKEPSETESPAPESPAEQPPITETPVEEPPAPEQPEAESPAMAEALPQADGPAQGNDLPQLWEEPQETTDRTARLRRQVMEALEGWQFYRYLARKARAADARVLNGMAGELHRHARKLSASYFLLTGLRYWPSELLSAPAIPSYWGALRTRHQTEQRQETAYRMAADDWDDPDLLDLYTELVDACQHRARQLRTLLEQGMS